MLESFDAHPIGLTAAPSNQTFGFFNQNLLMEYNNEQAVADGVNVDFDVSRNRTQITQAVSKLDISKNSWFLSSFRPKNEQTPSID